MNEWFILGTPLFPLSLSQERTSQSLSQIAGGQDAFKGQGQEDDAEFLSPGGLADERVEEELRASLGSAERELAVQAW